MKAWFVRENGEFCATVVFAETRGRAKVAAMRTDACADADFLDIEVRREASMDKYYTQGKTEMDWYSSDDRIALVKDCGFVCADEAFDFEDCGFCPANQYCDRYSDELKECEKNA